MTPEELREIEWRLECSAIIDEDVPALCSALREAWDEIERIDRIFQKVAEVGVNACELGEGQVQQLQADNARLKQCCDEAAKTCAEYSNRIKELEGKA